MRAMEDLPSFAALPVAERSHVGLVVHAGLDVFAAWLRRPGAPIPAAPEMLAAAPRELARAVNLKQTVQLIRVAVEIVEAAVPDLAAPATRRRCVSRCCGRQGTDRGRLRVERLPHHDGCGPGPHTALRRTHLAAERAARRHKRYGQRCGSRQRAAHGAHALPVPTPAPPIG